MQERAEGRAVRWRAPLLGTRLQSTLLQSTRLLSTLLQGTLLLGALLLAGCGGGGGGGGGDDEAVTLNCSATGHVLSGCWYGHQIRIDTNVTALSIAVAFNSQGKVTGYEARTPDSGDNGIFEATGTGAAELLAEAVTDAAVYKITGSDFETPLFIVTDGTADPSHIGFVQANADEGWLEVGAFQHTEPATWPPVDNQDYDIDLVTPKNYAGVSGQLTDDETFNTGVLDTSTVVALSAAGSDLSIAGGSDFWLSGQPHDGAVLTASTSGSFSASRGIFSGSFSTGAGTGMWDGHLVPSPDGEAVALIGCQNTAPDCDNPGSGMPSPSTFFQDFVLTWQWFQSVIVTD